MSRREKNSGAAMVIVLCVMVVFLALSTTILLAGSVTLNTARNNFIYERGKAQAVSLSELFAKAMLDPDSDLVQYVRNNITGGAWPVYDEKSDSAAASGAVKKFTMDTEVDGAKKEHRIAIEMYWTAKGTETPVTDEEEWAGAEHNVRLFVDVISTLNDSEYHVKREYKLQNIESVFGGTPGEAAVYRWKWNAEGRSEDRDKT